MLIFSLKKEWYEKIKNGEKTVEYREVKPYWSTRIADYLSRSPYPSIQTGKSDRVCYFQLGYKPETRLEAKILKLKIVDGKDTDLKIDKPVYAIHFELEKE